MRCLTMNAKPGVISAMLLVFFLFFMLLQGQVTVETALTGLVLSTLVWLFCRRFLDYSPSRDMAIARRLPRTLGYIFYLVREIFRAALSTMRCVWRGEVQPQLVSFRTGLKTHTGRLMLANSITLTPGTITVDIRGDKYLVHCLDLPMSQGLEDSGMEKRLRRIEEDDSHARE